MKTQKNKNTKEQTMTTLTNKINTKGQTMTTLKNKPAIKEPDPVADAIAEFAQGIDAFTMMQILACQNAVEVPVLDKLQEITSWKPIEFGDSPLQVNICNLWIQTDSSSSSYRVSVDLAEYDSFNYKDKYIKCLPSVDDDKSEPKRDVLGFQRDGCEYLRIDDDIRDYLALRQGHIEINCLAADMANTFASFLLTILRLLVPQRADLTGGRYSNRCLRLADKISKFIPKLNTINFSYNQVKSSDDKVVFTLREWRDIISEVSDDFGLLGGLRIDGPNAIEFSLCMNIMDACKRQISVIDDIGTKMGLNLCE